MRWRRTVPLADFTFSNAKKCAMNLFEWNPKKHDIEYLDGAIILAQQDHCHLVCPAGLDQIAELNEHFVDHYHVDGVPVTQVDNWAPDVWHPQDHELHNYVCANKADCWLEVDASEVGSCASEILWASAHGLSIRIKNDELEKALMKLKDITDALLVEVGHRKVTNGQLTTA